MKKSWNKKLTLSLSALGLAICIGGYAAADRFLIPHVEISNASALESAQTATVGTMTATQTSQKTNASGTGSDSVSGGTGTESTTADGTATTTQTDGSAASGTATVAKATNATITADSYKSDDASISIKKVTTGTGNDTVTYYVADVTVTDATVVRSAFANNSFGRNIIETTSNIAADNNAIFAINGDYYGFRSDGIVIRNGVIYQDKGARTGLAFYKDGTMKVYDETTTTAQELLDAGVWNTLSFGPALLVDSTIPTGIESMEVDTNFGNHSIQGNQPRTGIGIIDANHYVFVVVDGRSSGYSKGVTMTEFAQIFKDLGCTTAYNIDGGGSSTMYFNGSLVNNPLGRNQERGTSDILYIGG